MRCNNCGKDNEEGIDRCSWCGTNMGPSCAAKGGPKSRAVAIAVLAVIALAVVAVIAVNGMNNGSEYSSSGLSDTYAVTPEDSDGSDDSSDTDSTVVTDSITYVSDYSDMFTVEYGTDDSGQTTVKVTLVDSEASKYSKFTWYVYMDGSSNFLQYQNSVTKTDPTATWTLSDGTYGTFVFGVICQSSSGSWNPWDSWYPLNPWDSWYPLNPWNPWDSLNPLNPWDSWDYTEYTLTFTVNGTVTNDTVTKTYSWEYLGTDLTFTISYPYSEYDQYSGTNGASLQKRAGYNVGDFSVIPDFIEVNSTVEDIESNLESLYLENFGTVASGQGYAEFILAFVQECFTYTSDQALYGRLEYYAFPMETIYHGSGDCEDTSILCAALFDVADYDAGVFLIPGHAIAAVALDDYSSSAHSVSSDYRPYVAVFSLAEDGKTYYGCETTLESNECGVGYISTDYAITDGVIYYKNVAYKDGNYGLYLADSTA